MSTTVGRRENPDKSPFAVAPKEDLLYSLAQDGSRRWIDPVVTNGRFYKLRLGLAVALIALFLSLPLVQIAGKPGIFLDLARRQFTFAGATFHPTDNLILLAFGATIIIAVFAVTALFGRAWCGFACPQPIYMEFVYRPLERLFEGPRRNAIAKAGAAERLARRSAKWLSFAAVSLFLAGTFAAYFVGWADLVPGIFVAPSEHRGPLAVIVFLAVAMLVDFAYFRDQMCTVACPYGRLQTVLYDPDTVIVGYDGRRGEPRGRRQSGANDVALGDCVDCGRCISTCPTGMDIRRGLQMECIGCAQCIEACDEVMVKLDKAPGLIRFTSERELETGRRQFWRPRLGVYAVVFVAALGGLFGVAHGRKPAGLEVLRSGREPFRMLPNGDVANILRLRITNNLHEAQSFTVTLAEPHDAKLVVSESPLVVPGDGVSTVELVVTADDDLFEHNGGQATAQFVVSSSSGATFGKTFVLLGPAS
jgi:cytochrome c oxidase accessory protein FixG